MNSDIDWNLTWPCCPHVKSSPVAISLLSLVVTLGIVVDVVAVVVVVVICAGMVSVAGAVVGTML
eukprot:scaffold227498_cov51-Attheya_sp.AAC.1